jgi:hypothetical protein
MNCAPCSYTPDPQSTLDSLIAQLAEHEAREQADVVAPVGQVRLTSDGLMQVPGLYGALSLTEHARAQLARLLGVRWDTWFDGATSRERAEEVNRRLARIPTDVQVRVRTYRRAEGSEADGVVRAFVSPTYAPISDLAVARLVQGALRNAQGDTRLVRADVTDLSTSYVVVLGRPFRVGDDGEVGEVFGGLVVRNSGVGYAKLSVTLHLTRVACTNGLVVPLPEASLVRSVHRGVDIARVGEKIAAGLDGVAEKLHRGARLLEASTRNHVENADAEVRALLRGARLPLGLARDIMEAYAKEPRQSKFGVSQALTLAAQRVSPEIRFDLERLAGQYLVGA